MLSGQANAVPKDRKGAVDALRAQIPQMREFLEKFGDDLPDEISAQLDALEGRLAPA